MSHSVRGRCECGKAGFDVDAPHETVTFYRVRINDVWFFRFAELEIVVSV